MLDRRAVKAIATDAAALTLAVLAGVVWRGAPIFSAEFGAAAGVFALAVAARLASLAYDRGDRQ